MTEDSDKDKRIEELEELLQQHRTATQEVSRDPRCLFKCSE